MIRTTPQVLRIQNQSCSLESLAMTEADSAQVSVRPVTPADAELLLEIYKSSRGDDLRGLGWSEDRISEFLGMQYEAQQRFYEGEYKRAADEIILWEGRPGPSDRGTPRTRDSLYRCGATARTSEPPASAPS